jgi:hypothetical protein
MDNNQQEQQFSPEEIAAKREEMLEFYKSSMVYLKAQFEYEDMLLKLDETRFKRTNIQMQYAMMSQQMEGQEEEDDQEEELPTERKLKKRP